MPKSTKKKQTHFERFQDRAKGLYELSQLPQADVLYFVQLMISVEELYNLLCLMEVSK